MTTAAAGRLGCCSGEGLAARGSSAARSVAVTALGLGGEGDPRSSRWGFPAGFAVPASGMMACNDADSVGGGASPAAESEALSG